MQFDGSSERDGETCTQKSCYKVPENRYQLNERLCSTPYTPEGHDSNPTKSAYL